MLSKILWIIFGLITISVLVFFVFRDNFFQKTSAEFVPSTEKNILLNTHPKKNEGSKEPQIYAKG